MIIYYAVSSVFFLNDKQNNAPIIHNNRSTLIKTTVFLQSLEIFLTYKGKVKQSTLMQSTGENLISTATSDINGNLRQVYSNELLTVHSTTRLGQSLPELLFTLIIMFNYEKQCTCI